MRPVVAVTGANGYVGSLICRALTPHARVLPLVRKPQSPEERAWSFEMNEADLANLLQREGVTHIVHAAWDMKSSDLLQLERSCVDGTKRLIAAAGASGISSFVFISSMSAFAQARSAYGKSKLLAEQCVRDANGVVLRLGLVYGSHSGGVFGSLSKLASRLPLVPVIAGAGVQFLLPERSLQRAMIRAIRGDFAGQGVITLAHPRPVPLVQLVRAIMVSHGHRRTLLVPVPWQIIYVTLRVAEVLRIPLNFRSDSLLGFVHQDAQPDFSPLRACQIETEPFLPIMNE